MVGALCLALCAFALTPIVLAVLASVKTPAEAAACHRCIFPVD
jgi:hypothetical protein